MTPIITPELVKRYMIATNFSDVAADDWTIFHARNARDGLDAALDWAQIDRAALGMLAAAEMAHERATLAKRDRPGRAVGHELDALERSLVAAAGVDPEAWAKARGA